MPDHAIAAIEDAKTREAVLGVRSELFRSMDERDRRHDVELNRLLQLVTTLAQQVTQIATRFEDSSRNAFATQETTARMLREMNATLDDHRADDKGQFASITRMLIYGMGSLIMLLLGTVGTLTVKLIWH